MVHRQLFDKRKLHFKDIRGDTNLCLILCNESGSTPSIETLRRGRNSNSDGIGIAWKYTGEVYFSKGISFEELIGRVKWIGRNKLPYIIHFRIATSGAKVPQLCHPFPIVSKTNELFKLHGKSRAILAHNGTWYGWRSAIADPELANEIESSHWSDSAVMAWLLSQKKTISLSQMGYGHRVAVLSIKRGLDLYGGFSTDPKTGIHYSNRSWEWGSYRTTKSSTSSLAEAFDAAYFHYPYLDGEEIDYADPCSLPAAEVKAVDEVIEENTKLLAPPTSTETPAEPPARRIGFLSDERFQPHRDIVPRKGDILGSDGKLWRFFDDGGWRIIENPNIETK